MAIAGHRAQVKVSGPPASLADQATTADAGRTRYRTEASTGVFAPSASITVTRSDGVGGFAPVPAAQYTLDRLSGAVVFASAQPEGTVVRVSGQFLTLAPAAEAKEFSYTLTGNNTDVSSFGDGHTRRQQSLKDASGSLSMWTSADRRFESALVSGNPVILEFYSDSDNDPDLRAWAILSSDEMSAAVDGVQETSVEWEGTADADGRVVSLG